MATALVNGIVFTSEHWLTNQAVVIDEDKITAVCPANDLPSQVANTIDLKQQRLVPGFIDTQVNGGGGALFNDAPTLETLRIISEAHRAFGTTGFYPTLISDNLEVMQAGITAVKQAIKKKVPGVLGIHLEGPFLNPERKGVHDASKFKIIDESAFQILTSLDIGKTLITLAPELTTPEMIKRLINAGVIVSAGHSAATYEQTKIALASGLTSFTHLFNAMTPFTSREPGMVGAALEDKNSWCGIIADGFHVHPASLKIAYQAKTRGKIILVTDAMPSVGAINKNFMLNGELIRYDNGKLTTATGTLAGSDLTMISTVTNAISFLDITLDEAIRMASTYPAAMMGEKYLGEIKAGYTASMILIDDQNRVTRSWVNGRELTEN
ncbi:MAG: N-acetylglucosamine-6-phosphate deacetylase [Gammaproteobacteria bacterium]|nr:MAG: N-acetylglucosamine-6-phosphate deacetylase [Gammaproteobacteria bacterium]